MSSSSKATRAHNPKPNDFESPQRMAAGKQPYIGPISQNTEAGYVRSGNSSYRVCITIDEESRELLCAPNLLNDFPDDESRRLFQETASVRLQAATDPKLFLEELSHIISMYLPANIKAKVSSVPMHRYIVGELENVGWDNVTWTSKDLTRATLAFPDSGGRIHSFSVHFKEPGVLVYTPDLPLVDLPSLSDLSEYCIRFQNCFKDLEPFWEALEDLDQHCWILDPEEPTFSDLYRRVVVESRASLSIELNAQNSRDIPECRFFGSPAVINPIKTRFAANLHKWDSSFLPRENLERILGIRFPCKRVENVQEAEFNAECGICYSYKLGTSIPEELCKNLRCSRSFHHSCIFEWLKSLPNTRTSFDTVFGFCPYCSERFAVKSIPSNVV